MSSPTVTTSGSNFAEVKFHFMPPEAMAPWWSANENTIQHRPRDPQDAPVVSNFNENERARAKRMPVVVTSLGHAATSTRSC
jgi:hypothetical protein